MWKCGRVDLLGNGGFLGDASKILPRFFQESPNGKSEAQLGANQMNLGRLSDFLNRWQSRAKSNGEGIVAQRSALPPSSLFPLPSSFLPSDWVGSIGIGTTMDRARLEGISEGGLSAEETEKQAKTVGAGR